MEYAILSLIILAGAANGFGDMLLYRLPGPWIGHRWLDPDHSWQNKYRDWPEDQRAAYPLAKTALVMFTDAWHLSKWVQLTCYDVIIMLLLQPTWTGQWYDWLIGIAAIKVFRGAAFELVFEHQVILNRLHDMRRSLENLWASYGHRLAQVWVIATFVLAAWIGLKGNPNEFGSAQAAAIVIVVGSLVLYAIVISRWRTLRDKRDSPRSKT